MGRDLSKIVLFFASAALLGCAGNFGRLDYDKSINRIFESYEVLPDHKYYVTGPEGKPLAIMGIRSEYTLLPGLWREVKPNPADLETWIWRMNDGRMYYSYDKAMGYAILDPEKRPVGIWYSRHDWTLVKMKDGKRVVVGIPHEMDAPLFKHRRLRRPFQGRPAETGLRFRALGRSAGDSGNILNPNHIYGSGDSTVMIGHFCEQDPLKAGALILGIPDQRILRERIKTVSSAT